MPWTQHSNPSFHLDTSGHLLGYSQYWKYRAETDCQIFLEFPVVFRHFFSLSSLSYRPNHSVSPWHMHLTTLGRFADICGCNIVCINSSKVSKTQAGDKLFRNFHRVLLSFFVTFLFSFIEPLPSILTVYIGFSLPSPSVYKLHFTRELKLFR